MAAVVDAEILDTKNRVHVHCMVDDRIVPIHQNPYLFDSQRNGHKKKLIILLNTAWPSENLIAKNNGTFHMKKKKNNFFFFQNLTDAKTLRWTRCCHSPCSSANRDQNNANS